MVDRKKLVYLGFYKPMDFKNKLITMWTKGPYSHVDIVYPNETSKYGFRSYAATFSSGYVTTYDTDFLKYDIKLLPIIVDNKERGREFIKKQLGKKYDILGIIFSQIFTLGIDNTNKWFCSELATRWLLVSGTDIEALWSCKPELVHPNKLFNIIFDYYNQLSDNELYRNLLLEYKNVNEKIKTLRKKDSHES